MMELVDTKLDDARYYTDREFHTYQGLGVYANMPKFDGLFVSAQNRAKLVPFLRHEMPVLDEADMGAVKAMLSRKREQFCDSCVIDAQAMYPIQRQIYLDKAIKNTAMMGVGDTQRMLMHTHIYMSLDHYIIDGHHRWLSGFLLGDTPMLVFKARLPLGAFLAMAQEYTDTMKKERNA